MVNNMKKENLGRRINAVRKEKNMTADQLSERCNINATYLRQIEGGAKTPSLPVFIAICNVLEVSSDYLLQDTLLHNGNDQLAELSELWKEAPPSCRMMVIAMLKAALEKDQS